MRAGPPSIGIVANPVSARDIRRIIANASNLQIADRVNIVLRVLAAARSCGVESVLMMPDRGGIRALLARSLERERASTTTSPRCASWTWTSPRPSMTRSARPA